MSGSNQTNTKAVIAIVLGITTLVVLAVLPYLAWIFGIIGFFYANRSLKEIRNTLEKGGGLAVAAKVCSIVGIAVSALFIVVIGYGYMTYMNI